MIRLVRFINIGPYQVGFWPRWCLWFWRGRFVAYRWVVYLWPIEIRRFL